MKTAGFRKLALIGALAASACASSPGLVRTQLSATLTGQQQTPGPGDLDGTGTAQIRLDGAAGRLCWELNARGIGRATGAGIHEAAAGLVGPAVVSLTTPDASGRSAGCAAIAPDVAAQMALEAHRFYVAVTDEAHPQGAIRGQLRGGVTPRQPQPRSGRR